MDQEGQQPPVSEPATNAEEATAGEGGIPESPPLIDEIPPADDRPVIHRMPATMVLIFVILIVYGLTSMTHGFQVTDPLAQALGAFIPEAVNRGEYWRVITATLMHADLSHVFNNVFGLYIFGQLIEPWLGSKRTVLLFMASAMWGLLFSYFLVPNGTLGASTITYGEIGCYIALILLFRYRTDRVLFMRELRAALIFTVVFVGWNTMELGTINLWGHVGGFIAGLLFGYWVFEKHHPPPTAHEPK